MADTAAEQENDETQDDQSVQPTTADTALAWHEQPVVYLPDGTIDWESMHDSVPEAESDHEYYCEVMPIDFSKSQPSNLNPMFHVREDADCAIIGHRCNCPACRIPSPAKEGAQVNADTAVPAAASPATSVAPVPTPARALSIRVVRSLPWYAGLPSMVVGLTRGNRGPSFDSSSNQDAEIADMLASQQQTPVRPLMATPSPVRAQVPPIPLTFSAPPLVETVAESPGTPTVETIADSQVKRRRITSKTKAILPYIEDETSWAETIADTPKADTAKPKAKKKGRAKTKSKRKSKGKGKANRRGGPVNRTALQTQTPMEALSQSQMLPGSNRRRRTQKGSHRRDRPKV